jgi:hypothetical protein
LFGLQQVTRRQATEFNASSYRVEQFQGGLVSFMGLFMKGFAKLDLPQRCSDCAGELPSHGSGEPFRFIFCFFSHVATRAALAESPQRKQQPGFVFFQVIVVADLARLVNDKNRIFSRSTF